MRLKIMARENTVKKYTEIKYLTSRESEKFTTPKKKKLIRMK